VFSWLGNAWRVPELRKRVLFTALILALYRLGSHIPVPGVNADAVKADSDLVRVSEGMLVAKMATTKDILDFQNQLTTARGNEVQAETDYNVSLAELARSEGTLLDQYSVVVEVPGKRFVPWWARF